MVFVLFLSVDIAVVVVVAVVAAVIAAVVGVVEGVFGVVRKLKLFLHVCVSFSLFFTIFSFQIHNVQ